MSKSIQNIVLISVLVILIALATKLKGLDYFIRGLSREMLIDFVAMIATAIVAIPIFRFIKTDKSRFFTIIGFGIVAIFAALVYKSGFPPSPQAVAQMVRELILSIVFVIALWFSWKFLDKKPD